MAIVEVNGTSVFYVAHIESSTDEGAAVVLIHGAGGNHLVWPGSLRRLPSAKTYALDLPGHAGSAGQVRESIEDYVSDIQAFLDVLGLDRVVVVGHSMGGAIAQTLALTAPDRVLGLVLLGTSARLRVAPEFLEGVRTQFERTVSLIDYWMWAPGTGSELRDKGRQMMIQAGPQVLLGDFQACDQFDVRDQVGSIKAPTLVLTGTEDLMTPARFGQWLADQISCSRFVLIEGAGHMLMLERPREIADQVETFLVELT